MGNERRQVEDPNTKFGVQMPDVVRADTYVRPAAQPQEASINPLSQFFSEISPTLNATINRNNKIDAEKQDKAILEEAKQKRVSDVAAIFTSPEAFNKHAEDFNSLTMTAQNLMGEMYGMKMANKAVSDIEDKALREHWEQKDPDTVAALMQQTHGEVLGNLQAKAGEAVTIPGFSGAFSDTVMKHQKQFLDEHAPKYGKYLTEQVKTTLTGYVFDIAKNKVLNTQEKGELISKTLTGLYDKIDPRGNYNFNKDAVDALIQTDDLKLLRAFQDGNLPINLGKAANPNDKKELHKTVYAQEKVGDAILKLQKKQFEAHDETHKLMKMREESVLMFTQKSMTRGKSVDAQGRPIPKVPDSYEAYLSDYKNIFGDDGNQATKQEFRFYKQKGIAEVTNVLPMGPDRIQSGANRFAVVALRNGEEAVTRAIERAYPLASREDIKAMAAHAMTKATEASDVTFKRGDELIEREHTAANLNLNNSAIRANFKVKKETKDTFLHAVSSGSYEDASPYLTPQFQPALKSALKRYGTLSNMPSETKDSVLRMFMDSYNAQHPNGAKLFNTQHTEGATFTDNSNPNRPVEVTKKRE